MSIDLHRKVFQMEVSAMRNINISELLHLIANLVDKSKSRPKLLPYPEAAKMQKERMESVRYIPSRDLQHFS